MRIPLAREGYPFILASIFGIIIAWLFGLKVTGAIFGAITIFIVSFFRDPERTIPSEEDAIVSPADGRVIVIDKCSGDNPLLPPGDRFKICPHKGGMGGFVKISIFMNVFSVHVNRVPASGKVLNIFYNPGKFFPADKDKASLENEQNAILIEATNGSEFVVNQIAGLIARRIVCNLKEGGEVKKGERLGLIMFGSRVDVYIPVGCRVEVKVGDRVKGGSSLLGYWV
ncbi:MAG: phosphatidylserine decarboxylase family protein [Deltaproteobacteria bacterium]|nr:phosphatidylserine decarboxylase family protein [Deltaproteobacteria bacterium]